MTTHLFIANGFDPHLPSGASSSLLPANPAQAAADVREVTSNPEIEVLVFWDASLGPVPWSQVARFEQSLDDAWHPGSRLTGAENIDLQRYVEPLWIYRIAPAPDLVGPVNWRLDFRATFLRARVVRALGGLDGGFDTLAATARELGLRMFRRGAVCRQYPELVGATPPRPQLPTLADHYRLLRRRTSPKWTAYALARRLMTHPRSAPAELGAWRRSRDAKSVEAGAVGVLHRDVEAVALPKHVTTTVILPTYGRYRYVAEVLEDLRAQTIRPTQILIADGNPPEEREPEVYEQFADLPIELLWHEEAGICSGRNALLQRATGDLVWFVDDDSRFDPRNLELHLRTLIAYGADVSVGPAYMRGRPELAPEQREIACTFMDCGTTVCRRSIVEAVGGFDMQFNRHLAGEDNDIGIRFVRAGGLMLNNPLAKRFHYFAPVGGSRRKGSVHVFRRWSLRPRPVQSIYYLARRYFERSAAWDAMLHASIRIGWRRRDAMPPTRAWRLRTLVEEIAAVPLTALRFVRSARIGRRMIEVGPQIPVLSKLTSVESRRSNAY